MRDEKKKRQQNIALGVLAGLIVLGFIAYRYYPSKQETADETEQDESDKIEQITYAGDDAMDDTEAINKKEDVDKEHLEESKTTEDDVVINDIENKQPIAADDVKESEKPEASNKATLDTTDSNEKAKDTEVATNTESDKSSSSPKEESPVIVHKADTDSPSASVVEEKEKDEKKEKENEAETAELKNLIQKYDNIADRVSKFKKFQYKNGKLQIKLNKATDVDKDIDAKGKCLVLFDLSGDKQQISSIKNVAGSVEWNEEFVVNVEDALKNVLVVRLMEHDEKSEDKEVGKVEIRVVDVVASENSLLTNKEFVVVGSKSGVKLSLDLVYSEQESQQK